MKVLSFSKLCLASQSPRRSELLWQLGVSFDIMPARIDESQLADELPESYVERITKEKARAIWQSPEFGGDIPVLASDTAVIYDGTILGKPTDKADGKSMLRLLSGNHHQVMTGVVMRFEAKEVFVMNQSRVQFKPLSDDEIDRYWETGEGHDKAGCYAIQGMAASFIKQIQGSFSGVMGLPLFETSQLLEQFNVAFWKAK